MDDFTEFWILANTVKNASDTASGYDIGINDSKIAHQPVSINNQNLTTNRYQHVHCIFDGLFWECRASNGGATTGSNVAVTNGNAQFPYNVIENVGAAKTLKLLCPLPVYRDRKSVV